MFKFKKRCSVCGERKRLSRFSFNQKSGDGYMSRCKVCNRKVGQRSQWAKNGIEISEERYAEMRSEQNKRCAICGRTAKESVGGRQGKSGRKIQRLVVDHCHETGAVRALLCASCNSGIGMLGHEPARLEIAAKYLREWRRKEEKTAIIGDAPLEANNCFGNCQAVLIQHLGDPLLTRLAYVEGRGSKGPHAWLLLDGEIWDLTRERFWPKEEETVYGDPRPLAGDELQTWLQETLSLGGRPRHFRRVRMEGEIVVDYEDEPDGA